MKLAIFVPFSFLLPFSLHAATLALDPPVIYDCSSTVGKGTLHWSGASGPVQVRVGPSQVIMTGFGPANGSNDTGLWVSDGLEFRLVNQAGTTEAMTVAVVRCGQDSNAPGNGIVGNSYFPLEVGNTWIYKNNSRFITSGYVTRRVTGMRQFGTKLYAEITDLSTNTVLMYLRQDPGGALWRTIGTDPNASEEVYFSPGSEPHRVYASALGQYPDAVERTVQGGLSRTSETFVRGVGLVSSTETVVAGSSGGFGSSLELIDFHLATGPRVTRDLPRISVALDNLLLDVGGRNIDNCAVPCYFAACGLTPGADPAGTYKPCVRTRIEANATGDFWTDLTLINSAGQAVYGSPQVSTNGDAVRYLQLPLYSAPNQPFPAGAYRVLARIGQGSQEVASSSIAVQIQ